MAASDSVRSRADASAPWPSVVLTDSPPDVAHAIVRSTVLDRLEHRWDRAITTVVAGAGFGKSVAVGQAMRANRAHPRGIEAWVSCRTGCESPGRLANAVEVAFGVRASRPGSPISRLKAVFAEAAPLHVSLVLDDVELLPDPCAALLDDLLRSAPSNLHLLLCGRRLPPLALARVRAGDVVAEIGPDLLRFDAAEIASLAASMQAPPLQFDLGGWPALVRLALVAPGRAVEQYLWEEVIRALAPTDRAALLALCLLGASGADEVEAVTGSPFDPDGFCDRVPVVHRVGDQVVAHDLWSPHLARLGSEAEVATASTRAFEAVVARGDPIATGAYAMRLGDDEALRRASVDLVRATLGSLPWAWPSPGWAYCARRRCPGPAGTARPRTSDRRRTGRGRNPPPKPSCSSARWRTPGRQPTRRPTDSIGSRTGSARTRTWAARRPSSRWGHWQPMPAATSAISCRSRYGRARWPGATTIPLFGSW